MIARRRPIARSSKPIPRRTRPRRQRKGKRASLARQCDQLWGQIVRARGACEMRGHGGTCAGPLQAAHGFSRRYRSTRWLPLNGFCLCAGHHVEMTYDPIGWDNFLRVAWGTEVYKELRRIALVTGKPDHKAIVVKLQEELKGGCSW